MMSNCKKSKKNCHGTIQYGSLALMNCKLKQNILIKPDKTGSKTEETGHNRAKRKAKRAPNNPTTTTRNKTLGK